MVAAGDAIGALAPPENNRFVFSASVPKIH